MSKTFSPEALLAARRYFNDAEPRFWAWSDDAIAWNDGTTIVFYRELADIVRRLALDGLPRFTPLLLLLAACRENYGRYRVGNELLQEQAFVQVCIGSNFGVELLAALDRVVFLPQELRSSVDAKVGLIETVFDGQRFVAADDALSILELLRTIPPHELFAEAVRNDGFTGSQPRSIEHSQIWTKEELLGGELDTADERLRQIEARALSKLRKETEEGRARPNVTIALISMREGLNRIDADALRLRLRTGLDQLVRPAEIGPAPDESLRALVSRLRDDPELSGLGRLAHDLLAAVQVPRSISEPEDLRLGGVSDIANRGSLDRLLTSELAHDDLTLAVRVAVGEALYLRREAPPRSPVRERYLLIDCGIRLWGVPRVFAAAVGLALAATAERHTKTVAWRATADNIQSVDFCTREGLIALLGQLEAAPQPARALGPFFAAVDRTAALADAILVTHEDVLADPDFRRSLDEWENRQFYITAVDRDGRFRLYIRSGRGLKLVREAHFDLDRLLSPARRPAAALLRHNTGSDLPVILSVEPFPLLLTHQINLEQITYHPKHGAVTRSHDRRLMHWRQPQKGAAQLTASVPGGPILHLSIDDGGTVRALVGGSGEMPLRLLKVDLLSGERAIVDVDIAGEPSFRRLVPANIVLHQNTLFLILSSICVVHDNGQTSSRCVPTQRHKGGRYFSQSKQAWFALSFDGHAPLLTRVPLHDSIRPSTIVRMFDVRGEEGPLVITHEGSVIRVADGKELCSGNPGVRTDVLRISQCGRHLMVSRGAQSFHVFIDLDRSRADYSFCPGGKTLMPLMGGPELKRLLRSASLQHRFQKIATDGGARLLLIGRQGRVVAIDAIGRNPWILVDSDSTGKVRCEQSFEPAESPAGVGYTLRLARWADGSRAWLDSRGLLHLKSSDRSLAEITLVLVHSGQIPAWASDGRLWGPAFYTGVEPEETRPAEELLNEIEAFVGRLK